MKVRQIIWPGPVRNKLLAFRSERFTSEETHDYIVQIILETESLLRIPVKAAIAVNNDQKTILFRKASNRLITFNGLKVAVLGLTFKPGTDDLREAPSLENVPLLLEQGAEVYAYDPVGTLCLIYYDTEGTSRK